MEDICDTKQIAHFLLHGDNTNSSTLLCSENAISWIPLKTTLPNFDNISYVFEMLLNILCEIVIESKMQTDIIHADEVEDIVNTMFHRIGYGIHVEQYEQTEYDVPHYCRTTIKDDCPKHTFNSNIILTTSPLRFKGSFTHSIKSLSDMSAVMTINITNYRISFYEMY